MPGRLWIVVGALCGFLAVASGAFGAHLLKDAVAEWYTEPALAAKRMADWETGARYQMYHALAVIGVGLASPLTARRWRNAAGAAFLLGMLLFSGSLYVLVLSGQTWWGRVTPVGGLSFLAGWICLAVATLRGSGSLREGVTNN